MIESMRGQKYAGSGLELLHQRVCATSDHSPSITFTPLRNNKEPENLVHSDLGIVTSLVHFCDVTIRDLTPLSRDSLVTKKARHMAGLDIGWGTRIRT